MAELCRTHPGTSPIYLLHYSASLLLPLHPYFLPPPLLIRLSIRGRVDRLALCDLGRAQLLEWVIVISSCLDQLGLIWAERLWTGAGGTADYSHQRQICETIQVLLRLLQTNCFIWAPSKADLRRSADGLRVCRRWDEPSKAAGDDRHTCVCVDRSIAHSRCLTWACGIGLTLRRSLKRNWGFCPRQIYLCWWYSCLIFP